MVYIYFIEKIRKDGNVGSGNVGMGRVRHQESRPEDGPEKVSCLTFVKIYFLWPRLAFQNGRVGMWEWESAQRLLLATTIVILLQHHLHPTAQPTSTLGLSSVTHYSLPFTCSPTNTNAYNHDQVW